MGLVSRRGAAVGAVLPHEQHVRPPDQRALDGSGKDRLLVAGVAASGVEDLDAGGAPAHPHITEQLGVALPHGIDHGLAQLHHLLHADVLGFRVIQAELGIAGGARHLKHGSGADLRKLHGALDQSLDILGVVGGGEAGAAVLHDAQGSPGGLLCLEVFQAVGLERGGVVTPPEAEDLRLLASLHGEAQDALQPTSLPPGTPGSVCEGCRC